LRKITVIGSGSWGTALAIHSYRLGHSVSLWTPFIEEYNQLTRSRVNERFLPGHSIPKEIEITNEIQACCPHTEGILFAVPSHALRTVVRGMQALVRADAALISAVKGIETESGANTVAALITRGLAEISRLVLAAGGKADTLAGLAGLGDLVLTCTGSASRNRQVGIALGKGRMLAEILQELGQTAEGVKTTESALGLAGKYGVEMPIVSQMYAILYQGIPPRQAVAELMERELKMENWS